MEEKIKDFLMFVMQRFAAHQWLEMDWTTPSSLLKVIQFCKTKFRILQHPGCVNEITAYHLEFAFSECSGPNYFWCCSIEVNGKDEPGPMAVGLFSQVLNFHVWLELDKWIYNYENCFDNVFVKFFCEWLSSNWEQVYEYIQLCILLSTFCV